MASSLSFLAFLMSTCVELTMESACKEEEAACYQVVPYQPAQDHILPMFTQETRDFQFAGKAWSVKQQWNEIGVASVIWEPAILLARYLEELGSARLEGARVIELGAGTGLVGMVASALGASTVVLTDKDTRPAEINLKHSRPNLEGRNVSVSALEWGSDVESFRPPFDVVLAADVIYIEESFPALIRTLAELSNPSSLVLLACKYRYERDNRFFELLRQGGMFEEPEVVRRWPDRDDVKVYRLKRTKSKDSNH